MESKNYHFNVSNPELISKIERFNEYGFANRTDFFLEAIKAYDTIFTPENSLKKLITDAVMDGIVGALNIETQLMMVIKQILKTVMKIISSTLSKNCKNLHYLIPTLDIKSSKRGLRGLPNKMQIVYNLRILLIKK